MASGRMEFHARSIMQHSNFSFVLPNDIEIDEVKDKRHYEREPLNLILLHGLTGTDTDWLFGGNAQWMAIQYNVNIFMPTTGNSFYLNKGYTGGEYATFIAEELPDYIGKTFGIKMEKSNSMIGGLSMGGYGTLRTALAYPDRFSSCIALSSALIIGALKAEEHNEIMPRQMNLDIFGDPEKIEESDKNPEYLYRMLRKNGRSASEIPKIYFACGTEDSLISDNRKFRDFLSGQKADFIYEEGPGKHDWDFWCKYLDRGLDALLSGR